MKILDGFFIPDLRDSDHEGWELTPASDSDVSVRWPRLTPDGLRRITAGLRNAGERLRKRPVAEIVSMIDAATQHLAETIHSDATLVDGISAFTRYSSPMTRYVLDRMMQDWRAAALNDLLLSELGDPGVLDTFVTGPAHAAEAAHTTQSARRTRDHRITASSVAPANSAASVSSRHAVGPDLSLHIFSGNVPGVAVTSMVRALLVKAPVLGKPASGEPILAAAFARAIERVDPDLAAAVAIAYWPGGSTEIEDAAFAAADAVIHYGSGGAIADVQRRMPAGTRLLEHGPRISFGLVAREALATEDAVTQLAADIAYAVAMFDQQGCVSPHSVFVETGGSIDPPTFAERIHHALKAIASELPPGRLTLEDATAIRSARETAEFRMIAGQSITSWGEKGGHTVIFDATPRFNASCLNRTLYVYPVASMMDVIPVIAPARHLLQSVAIAAGTDAVDPLRDQLVQAGATRLTSFRDLPWPPPTWHHDGRGPLLELLRWVDFEPF